MSAPYRQGIIVRPTEPINFAQQLRLDEADPCGTLEGAAAWSAGHPDVAAGESAADPLSTPRPPLGAFALDRNKRIGSAGSRRPGSKPGTNRGKAWDQRPKLELRPATPSIFGEHWVERTRVIQQRDHLKALMAKHQKRGADQRTLKKQGPDGAVRKKSTSPSMPERVVRIKGSAGWQNYSSRYAQVRLATAEEKKKVSEAYHNDAQKLWAATLLRDLAGQPAPKVLTDLDSGPTVTTFTDKTFHDSVTGHSMRTPRDGMTTNAQERSRPATAGPQRPATARVGGRTKPLKFHGISIKNAIDNATLKDSAFSCTGAVVEGHACGFYKEPKPMLDRPSTAGGVREDPHYQPRRPTSQCGRVSKAESRAQSRLTAASSHHEEVHPVVSNLHFNSPSRASSRQAGDRPDNVSTVGETTHHHATYLQPQPTPLTFFDSSHSVPNCVVVGNSLGRDSERRTS